MGFFGPGVTKVVLEILREPFGEDRAGSLTLIEVRHPLVLLALMRFIVEAGTLGHPESGFLGRAGVRVAGLVASSLSHAKPTPGSGPGVVALPFHDGDSRTASSGTCAPRAPFAPATVDGHGRFHNWNTL